MLRPERPESRARQYRKSDVVKKSGDAVAGSTVAGGKKFSLPTALTLDAEDEDTVDTNSPLFMSEGSIARPTGSPKNGRPTRRHFKTENLSSPRGPRATSSQRVNSQKMPSPSPRVEPHRGKLDSWEQPTTSGSFQSESDLSELMASEVDKGLTSSQGTPRSRPSKTSVRGSRGVSMSQELPRPSTSSMRNSRIEDVESSPLSPLSASTGRSSSKKSTKGPGRLSFPEDEELPRPSSSMSIRSTRIEDGDSPRSLTSLASPRPGTSPSTPQAPRSPSRKSQRGASKQIPDDEDMMLPSRPSSSMSVRASVRTEPEVPSRRLSFVGVSMTDVWEAIQEEEPFLDWLPEFWDRVLTAPCPAACKTLALRSMANWVAMYNRWQAVGEWNPGNAPRFFNAFEAQQMLGIPLPRVMEFVKLFDPPGYQRANQTKSPQDYVRVKLPVSALLAVCVLMSTAISKKQKIRFLLGVFDENDNHTFEEEEFVEMLLAMYRGMAAMFNMLNLKEAIPSKQRMEALAQHIFRRISNLHRDKSGRELLEESLPFSVIEDWFLGESDDPLNVPFALFIYRYSTPGEEEDPELFEDEDKKFRLSHTHPVDPPMETAASLDATFLNRHEVIVAYKLFNHCISNGGFGISHSAAEAAVGTIDCELWITKLHRALDQAEDARGVSRTTLTSFFKKVCPKAAPRHLRMFHGWIKEYEQLETLHQKEYIALPKLPAKFRQEISLDWSVRAPEQEFEDFLQNNCPPGFRPFDGNPKVDQLIEEMLLHHLAQQELLIQQWTRLFAHRKSHEATLCSKPVVLKPRVPDEEWKTWNEVLDLLEFPAHGPINKEKLIETRLLSPQVANYLMSIMARGVYDRTGFLRMLSELKKYRTRN